MSMIGQLGASNLDLCVTTVSVMKIHKIIRIGQYLKMFYPNDPKVKRKVERQRHTLRHTRCSREGCNSKQDSKWLICTNTLRTTHFIKPYFKPYCSKICATFELMKILDEER